MLKMFAVVLLGWFGNPLEWLDLWRIWIALLLGLVIVGLGYRMSLPEILPIWPGLVVLCIAVLGGMFWQRWVDTQ